MLTKMKTPRILLLVCMWGPLLPAVFADAWATDPRAAYEQSVVVTATASKAVYKVGEAVPIVVTISNDREKSVYTFSGESDFLNGFASVSDASGKQIMGDPIPTPPIPPANHYVRQNGQLRYVVPVYEIGSHGIMRMTIADALRLYRKRLPEGPYSLGLGDVEVIHEVGNLITREDVPHRLWVDPSSPMTKVRHKFNTVKIEIQGRVEGEVPDQLETDPGTQPQPDPSRASASRAGAEAQPGAIAGRRWILSVLVGGVAVGTGALLLVLLKRKSSSVRW